MNSTGIPGVQERCVNCNALMSEHINGCPIYPPMGTPGVTCPAAARGDGCVAHGLAHPCEVCAAEVQLEQMRTDGSADDITEAAAHLERVKHDHGVLVDEHAGEVERLLDEQDASTVGGVGLLNGEVVDPPATHGGGNV